VFVRAYSYTDSLSMIRDRPWIVVEEIRRLTVELDAGENFYEWAAGKWPKPRYEVQLDPWQLSPKASL
jgi:hypothetical protein